MAESWGEGAEEVAGNAGPDAGPDDDAPGETAIDETVRGEIVGAAPHESAASVARLLAHPLEVGVEADDDDDHPILVDLTAGSTSAERRRDLREGQEMEKAVTNIEKEEV